MPYKCWTGPIYAFWTHFVTHPRLYLLYSNIDYIYIYKNTSVLHAAPCGVCSPKRWLDFLWRCRKKYRKLTALRHTHKRCQPLVRLHNMPKNMLCGAKLAVDEVDWTSTEHRMGAEKGDDGRDFFVVHQAIVPCTYAHKAEWKTERKKKGKKIIYYR